ncbi:Transcription factor jumonji/aspartyl beta-hydroxylase [Metarhizium rileyi]|uniref:Transcription factor jumonji/aspartyl beta-hydroxylase n=1 Tax=Metarhizium rileyi (strain RCEF 4871) TaxID=1649241 RepID=A0A167KR43_METRR|nr:Transcription factor jumonji/aspartyl beta-hydroxylase [Metarhizium rileyi RCEF 4871]
MTSHIESALKDLISTYNELNSSTIDELDSEPSPLEFMRYVSRNTPFVIRGASSSWKATREWNAAYLRTALTGQTVNVAVTPHGNADAPTFSPKDGVTVLSKPLEESEMFSDFLTYITQQEQDETFPRDSEVRYAQTLCHPCMNEALLTPATYVRDETGLSIRVDEGAELVPYAQPMRVTLNPGDMLYLPAMWYHKVSQSSIPGGEGFVVAINYWYDMDFSGPVYPMVALVRAMAQRNTSKSLEG